MPIVVFWIEPEGQGAQRVFGDAELVAALQCSEALRREGHRHVCLSSELAGSVGAAGVAAVEQGRLPSGETYEFSKAHRGAGPRRDPP